MGAQHEILNQEGLVAFEARAGRDGPGLDDALLMNGQIGALGALAPAFARRTLLGRGLAGLLHATRLDLGPAFEPLETGDLVPLGRDGALQLGDLDHERNHQRLEIRKRPRVQISGQSHARNQSEITPAGNPIRPDFCSSYSDGPQGFVFAGFSVRQWLSQRPPPWPKFPPLPWPDFAPPCTITSPPTSIEPPGPKPSRPGPRSPPWPLGHKPSCDPPSCVLSRPEPIKLTVPSASRSDNSSDETRCHDARATAECLTFRAHKLLPNQSGACFWDARAPVWVRSAAW